VLAAALLVPSVCLGQTAALGPPVVEPEDGRVRLAHVAKPGAQAPTIDRPQEPPRSALYIDQTGGASATDLVRTALSANAELAAARLDIERSRARLRQVGLWQNPTVEFEQSTGRFTGSPGERETSVGVTFPLEVGGQRRARINLAEAELAAAEAEVANAERRLRADVLAKYIEALSALRELQTAEHLLQLDTSTFRVVEVRVVEGESAPLESSLMRVEVERLRAQQVLAEGKLRAALLALTALTGAPPATPPRLREELASPLVLPPASEQEAVRLALASRPDLRLARLNEAVAKAGLRLARAEGRPSVDVTARYTTGQSITDLPEPLVPVPDRSRTLAFGVAVSLPVFNRNQGAKAEAAAAIRQAELRTAFAEATVRSEVASAFARAEAAERAVTLFEQGVLARSVDNVRVLREAYQLGAFPVADLLAEQRKLADSQREYTELLAERYRALVDLQAAVGLAQTDTEATPVTPTLPTEPKPSGAAPAAEPVRVETPSPTTVAEEPR
jgi:cobalt-zinc-cadmium efflux system outer membrane protein